MLLGKEPIGGSARERGFTKCDGNTYADALLGGMPGGMIGGMKFTPKPEPPETKPVRPILVPEPKPGGQGPVLVVA